MTQLEEVSDAKARIASILTQASMYEEVLHRKIDRIWTALIVAVAAGAFVLGGLVIHVAGDYGRFRELHASIENIQEEIVRLHTEAFHESPKEQR